MSAVERAQVVVERARTAVDRRDWAATRALLLRVVVGDRYGLALLLGGLVFFGLYWRVGVFVNDNYTVANALAAVAEGHLWIDRAVYGPGLNTPGMHLVDGRAYGRNYGHVFLALPLYWAFEAVDAVADLRVALSAGWSLLALALAVVVGGLVDRERAFAAGGSAVAAGLFLGNVAVATPLDPRWTAWLALQASAMVAAGLCGVVLYRLLARMHDRRTGLVAGAAVVLASPVAFWASLPKRHVLTALFALCTLYCLHRARAERDLRFRALAYVPVGLTAWVHAPEAFVLFAALGAVDLLTAESNDVRSLLAVGAAFALSLLPFLATNLLISGSPLRPPRLLPNYTPGADGLLSEGSGGGGAGSGDSGGDSLVPGFVGSTLDRVMVFVALLTQGVDAVVGEPAEVFETYVRSGYLPGETVRDGGESINLTVLESFPVLGALAAIPVAAVRRVRGGLRRDATAATDAFVVVYVLLLALLYQPRLPLYAQVTVRYLLPLYPLLCYAVVRLPAVRRVVRERGTLLTWSYAAAVLVGTQVLLAWLLVTGAALGEAVQAHGLVGVGAGLLVAGWAVAATVRGDREDGDERLGRAGAVLLGTAAGAGTAFVLLSGLYYFAYAGDFALPVVEVVAGALP